MSVSGRFRGCSRGLLPAGVHADGEQCEQRQHRHDEDLIEVWRPDRDLSEAERFKKERIERADQDQAGRDHQQDVIEYQERLARHGFEPAARAQRRPAPGIERQRAADAHAEKGQDEEPAAGVACERVHGYEHAGSDQERPEQGQRECQDRQQQRPAAEQPTLLGHRERMNQRGADQPRHEGRVLHRIPEPPAAPAELVVRPPAAERDTDREKEPRERGPWPRPARPARIEAAFEHGGHRKGERHGEADITDVQHRRVHREREVLQHRVQVAAVRGCRRQPLERIRGQQDEEQEPGAHDAKDTQHACGERFRELPAEGRNRQRPGRERERPEHERSFMRAPYRREAVERRQRGVGVLRDIQHGKVIALERPGQHGERHGDEHPLPRDGGSGDRHVTRGSHRRADQPETGLRHREQQRHDQGEMSEFDAHVCSLRY